MGVVTTKDARPPSPGQTPLPCQHVCDLRDLKYEPEAVTCTVCARRWVLLAAVPEKDWPPRWFPNCPRGWAPKCRVECPHKERLIVTQMAEAKRKETKDTNVSNRKAHRR